MFFVVNFSMNKLEHIGIAVADLEASEALFSGFDLIHTQPKPGADGKIIAFLHPKSTNSVLTEMCQTANK